MRPRPLDLLDLPFFAVPCPAIPPGLRRAFECQIPTLFVYAIN